MTAIQYAYARWVRKRLPLPSDHQVAALEERLGVELPGDYRQYLLDFNGGFFEDPEILSPDNNCPRRGLDAMFGIGADEPSVELGTPQKIALFDDNDPLAVLPIGRTGFGDLITLEIVPDDRGSVYFKEASGGWYELADGIEEFFANLREPDWG